MKIYEGEHHRRGFLEASGDGDGIRALRLRKALPRLEMPCVRAATSSIGVRLDRLRVPRPIRRKIFALALGPGLETATVAGVLPYGARFSWNRGSGPRSADHQRALAAHESYGGLFVGLGRRGYRRGCARGFGRRGRRIGRIDLPAPNDRWNSSDTRVNTKHTKINPRSTRARPPRSSGSSLLHPTPARRISGGHHKMNRPSQMSRSAQI